MDGYKSIRSIATDLDRNRNLLGYLVNEHLIDHRRGPKNEKFLGPAAQKRLRTLLDEYDRKTAGEVSVAS